MDQASCEMKREKRPKRRMLCLHTANFLHEAGNTSNVYDLRLALNRNNEVFKYLEDELSMPKSAASRSGPYIINFVEGYICT